MVTYSRKHWQDKTMLNIAHIKILKCGEWSNMPNKY